MAKHDAKHDTKKHAAEEPVAHDLRPVSRATVETPKELLVDVVIVGPHGDHDSDDAETITVVTETGLPPRAFVRNGVEWHHKTENAKGQWVYRTD